MVDKIKKIFKDEKKKNENLVFFLIVLVITLVLINRIITEDKEDKKEENRILDSNIQLVDSVTTQNDLEERLENILEKISGVGNVSVMITYSESSSILPLYNETTNSSIMDETIEQGNTKTTQTNESKKEVLVDSDLNPIIEKNISPKIEGAIVAAQGAKNSNVKADIISAVEAVTGLATHKIQVFNME